MNRLLEMLVMAGAAVLVGIAALCGTLVIVAIPLGIGAVCIAAAHWLWVH